MYKNLNGLHYQHREDIRSYSCVSLSWLNGVTQYYCSRNLCDFAYCNKYYVSRFVITSINTSSQSTTTSCRSVWRRTSDAEEEEEVSISFDYCSLHVSTVISYVSTVPVSSSLQNGLHYQHREDIRSYSCVSLSWLNGVTQYYCSRNLCDFAYCNKYYLVPFATRVRMDVKAFPSRPSVPLLITNSQRRNSILFMTAMKYVK
ncbi:hypothetical protein T02_16079 [Trichinella nativa]|uniref:Uncharacterized protein n=1 Tax=Trichinella nativa TaxID=6335 RepID=A0A0V1KTE7_9BILA|nr:hypothetical protein T02_16079 [Trichinella nativa]